MPTTLLGTVVAEPSPAPDFTLTDQHGSSFHMADTTGRVVVLTFIYTHCTDICPFISLKLKEARKLLGTYADQAVFLAVTTDPARDTLPVIAAYSKEIGLFDTWHFMTGPVAEVQAVWDEYRIGVDFEGEEPPETDEVQQAEGSYENTEGLTGEDLRVAKQIVGQFGGGYEVSHTAPFWIIDRRGNLRVILDADAFPRDIASDMRTLIRER